MQGNKNDFRLGLILFFSGAVVMILELTGARLAAPYIGTSIFIWTSLIGVILACLSIGYALGGRLADNGASLKGLSLILLIGAGGVVLLLILHIPVMSYARTVDLDMRLRAVLTTVVLYALPSVALGCVAPYIIRLKLNELESSGHVVGTLYAVSTLGSIFGTFLSGFFLFSWCGSLNVLNGLACTLLVLSCYAYLPPRKVASYALHIAVLAAVALNFVLPAERLDIFADSQLVADVDTMYGRYWVKDSVDPAVHRPIRALISDPLGMQSAIYLDNPDELYFLPVKYFRLAEYFQGTSQDALLIGGGALILPMDFIRRNPRGSMDVVEIDEQLKGLAEKFFYFKDDPRLNFYFEDGRTFINGNRKQYDTIFVDAYGANLMPPFHLTTVEFVQALKRSLNPTGIVLVNLVSALCRGRDGFLRSSIKTYQQEFRNIHVIRMQPQSNPYDFQNLLMLAYNDLKQGHPQEGGDEYAALLRDPWRVSDAAEGAILTDDFAPVERYFNVGRYFSSLQHGCDDTGT